ncbi:hypothetical protein AV530_018063 [Patagioenas fasciata monilis]|uniref:KIAA1755 n=1 Tax=Patagioenas fasciata monilis TaxID=372326 RepID=A0A1V4KKX1_PATFA|nr:hypothetical protein AV530_018063 [Patagioenas fasciata monilis]
MDAGSLDTAVQGALQALYPPFEATAPTVLGQVFRLLETRYQGDGLCCLLRFLIPAKRLFEHVRQAACAPYFNCIFLHEGWPLCLHEKVVVHLAPLNPLLLRPGDFYLQAEPCEELSARITLKHLSLDLHTVEETPVPEAAYALLFTNEWLEEINSNQARVPLHTCLVATENGVAPVPWSSIATPQFIDKPKAAANAGIPAPYGNIASTIPGCKGTPRKSSQGSQNLEGEYVDLLDPSQEQPDLLTRSPPPVCPNPLSISPGLMSAILEEPDGPGPEPPPTTPNDTPTQLGSSHKFSFLKGPRLGASPGDERATSQHEGAWKKISAIYSPRMGRAKPAGKGMNGTALESSSCKSGPPMPSAGTPGWDPPAWQDLHTGLLRSGIVTLPGSSDRLGRTLLQVNTSSSAWGATWCSAAELARLILHLCSLPRQEAKDGGLTVVVDARKQPPAPILFSALRSVQSVSLGCIHTVLLLAEKELAHRERLPGAQVETLASLKALGRYIDSSQLTPELNGTFPYCHSEWVQFFQNLHPFMAGLRRASELLQSCIQELRSTNVLAGTQDAAAGIRRHQELMQRVLSNPQLVQVQREGGAMLARLRRAAARLHSSANVRTSMELAEELYSQLEGELHDLVSQSNSCLERLEFLQKVRELEAEFSKLGSWLDGEAAVRLQDLGAEECSPDGSQGSAEWCSEFFSQAAARYRCGLALCQEAAAVQDAVFPEAQPFQAAATLFQTRLMRFHGQLERRQVEWELRRELGRFSSKLAGLERGCGQGPAQGQRGGGRALLCLQSSFQKLSVELALEKLEEMKAQVCSNPPVKCLCPCKPQLPSSRYVSVPHRRTGLMSILGPPVQKGLTQQEKPRHLHRLLPPAGPVALGSRPGKPPQA